jgi:hypothetical protein
MKPDINREKKKTSIESKMGFLIFFAKKNQKSHFALSAPFWGEFFPNCFGLQAL